MFSTHIFGSVKTRRPSSDRARASKVYPSSATSADMTNTYTRSAKEDEFLAAKAAVQARSPDKLQRTLFGHEHESSRHKQSLDPEIPTNTSSDIFSPPVPTSPLPEYSYPPQYSPPRRSKELPIEATPEPQRRTPARSSREVSPPPKYHKEDVFDINDLYSSAKPRSAGRTLPTSKPIDEITCDSIYSLVEDHAVDMTPPKPGRLALAAAREDRWSKKEFESYKRQTRNQVPSRAEELDNDPESDDLMKSILGDIAAIGGSSSRHAATRSAVTRGAFDHAFGRN